LLNKTIVIVCMCLALTLSGGISAASAYTVSPRDAGSTGIVVPLYTYPTDSSWSALISIKQSYPSVPIIAVINPSNGPGSEDPNYASGIQNLQAAGITVLGYVHTSWGSRNISDIESEISEYKTWYGVNGIFFDEMSTSASSLSYYAALANFTKSLGLGITMGNPGQGVDPRLVGVFTILNIYENAGMPSPSQINSYPSDGKADFAYMAYGVNSLPNQTTVQGLTSYVSYLYITNLGGSNPYNGLPSYLANETAMLAS
jgi:hypothetical protein